MTANRAFSTRRAIATVMVVMAFFVLSCEKRVIIEAPVEKVIIEKIPEKAQEVVVGTAQFLCKSSTLCPPGKPCRRLLLS